MTANTAPRLPGTRPSETKRDLRSVATTSRLIETAERLFAEHGIDGVSLRQIADAAGQNNKFAVQYHFGGKPSLLKAIVAYRLPRIDAMRGSLLHELMAADPDPDARALLEVLVRPLAAEALNPDSRYVSFLSRARFYDLDGEHWWHSDRDAIISPLGSSVAELILDRLAHLPKSVRLSRFRTLVGTWLLALAGYETSAAPHPQHPRQRLHELPLEVFLIDLLDTTALALAAPLTPAADVALNSVTGPMPIPTKRRED